VKPLAFFIRYAEAPRFSEAMATEVAYRGAKLLPKAGEEKIKPKN
jgi:hypothetical protein